MLEIICVVHETWLFIGARLIQFYRFTWNS